MPRLPRLASHAALLVLALWTLSGCVIEVRQAIAERTAGRPLGFSRWQLDTPQSDRLIAFASAVGEQVPAGSVIAFATGAGRGDAEFFQSLWLAYELPRHRVIRLSHRRAAQEAEFLAAYGPRVEHPRLGEAQPLPGGWLYPVRPR